MKRAFDVIGSALGILLLAPLFAVIALLILFADGRPVVFRQERVGHRGKPFRMYKFRTMVREADTLGMPLTLGDDPRITKLGRRLRKLKVDELPQLFNVLFGHMSLVGPRPEVARYVGRYDQRQMQVLELKPGITDPASIIYRCESDLLAGLEDPEQTYMESIVPDKIRINLEYARRANVFRDCAVVFKTLTRLCRVS